MMKKLYLLSISLLCIIGLQAQNCSELFISEYVEGWSNNKAIELFNPTNQDIDLSNYSLSRWGNGSTTPQPTILEGTIAANSAFVIGLDKRDPNGEGYEAPLWNGWFHFTDSITMLPDSIYDDELNLMDRIDLFICPTYEDGTMYFTGNDAVTLETTSGDILDIIGKVGEDPGEAWADETGAYWTKNHTLVRKSNVYGGFVYDTSAEYYFDPTIEWDSLPANTFVNLGTHDCGCQFVGEAMIFENFDSYTTGGYLAAQSNGIWNTWSNSPGSAEDAEISMDYAYSEPNSVKFETGGSTDIILPLGNKTSGKWNMSFMILIPSGNGGYFNMLHDFNGNNSNWAFDVLFSESGSATLYKGGAASTNTLSFTYDHDKWFLVSLDINVFEGTIEGTIDGANLSWDWTIGSQSVSSTIGALNIYAYAPNDGTGLYYIDDVVFIQIESEEEELVYGCTNPDADNYNPNATEDDGSCVLSGCLEIWADNYNPNVTNDDGSCELTACPYSDYIEYDSNYTIADASMCQTWITEGCTNPVATNYNPEANVNDGSCVVIGCMNSEADNFNPEATIEEENSCIIYGCTNSTAENYNDDATIENGTCIIYGCTLSPYSNYNPEATYDDGSCNMVSSDVYGCTDQGALNYNSQANIDNGACEYMFTPQECEGGFSIILLDGWNLIGYSCVNTINAETAFAPLIDILIIAKDNAGNAYLPEWNFNGIGDLLGGYGYQLKITEQVNNFNICE